MLYLGGKRILGIL